MADTTPGAAPVTDHRDPPRGVLPRSAQTWLMVGLALGILAIIVFTGHQQPAQRTGPATLQAPATNPERLRDYQDRLRVLDDRSRQQTVTEPRLATPRQLRDEPPAPAAPDPLEADRSRREYESLFASNVVASKRPETQRLATPAGTSVGTSGGMQPGRGLRPGSTAGEAPPAPPSLDEVAEAVMRATARTGQAAVPAPVNWPSGTSSPASDTKSADASSAAKMGPTSSGPIPSEGPLHRILEGTVIDTVLTNRLDGSSAAPVNCLVTNPIYSHDRQHILIPAGARALGETKPVQSAGQTHLAVTFHRLLLPDGRTYALDQFIGLNQIGDSGLRDQVNQHYWSTFGAAAAVGVISGLGQSLGTFGLGQDGGNSTVVMAGGLGNATAQATTQVMSHFLNRLPTVTIREGHRVKVYLTSDLELPAYESGSASPGSSPVPAP